MRLCFQQFLFVLTLTLVATPALAEGPIVSTLEGSALVRGDGPISAGQQLNWGDEVIVAAGAELDIVAGAEFALKLWGPTSVELKQTQKSQFPWIEVLYGRLIAAFKPGSRSYLATRSNVAGVRGTVVYLEDTPELPDYACVCEGKVKHSHRKNKQASRLVETVHHETPIVATRDGLVDSSMQNHDDTHVNAVKALIHKP